MATTEELASDTSPDWKISRLTEQLEIHKSNWKVTHPGDVFPGELILAADVDVDSTVLKKVLYSVGITGFHKLQLAVERKPDSARR